MKKRAGRPNKNSTSTSEEAAKRNYLEGEYALIGLLEGAKSGHGKVYALDSLVRLLDAYCAKLEQLAESPPREAAEAVRKVLASKVRLPINVCDKPLELKRVALLLRRRGVGRAYLRLPHKLKQGRNRNLQLFAASLISQTLELRRRIEDYGASADDFQQRLSKLPLLPDKRWRPLVLRSAEYFHGKDWLEKNEHCARWAKPWRDNPRKLIPEHRSKRLRAAGDNTGVRKAKLQEHAEYLLRECLVSLIGNFST
jgi:hypothetical protein